jgi:hypothetical protein
VVILLRSPRAGNNTARKHQVAMLGKIALLCKATIPAVDYPDSLFSAAL